MNSEEIIAIIGGIIAVSGVAILIIRKIPKKIKQQKYVKKWREIQRLCADAFNWPEAVVTADELLDEVMRKRRKSGKSMGERLVTCQNLFTNNDMTWKAHKLAGHINHSTDPKLSESDVKDALIGFRQALRDLGAL